MKLILKLIMVALATFSVLVGLRTLGQMIHPGDTHYWVAQPSTTASTPTLPTNYLLYRWVASDLTDGLVTTWTDRVSGIIFYNYNGNTNYCPTKTSNYVNFAGSDSLYNTNGFYLGIGTSPLGRTNTIVLILKMMGSDSTVQSLLTRFDTDANGFVCNYSGNASINLMGWANGPNTPGIGNDGTIKTVVYLAKPNKQWFVYRNNSVVATNDVLNLLLIKAMGSGSGTGNPLTARIYEVIVYDDPGLSMTISDVDTIYRYSTNTYGL